jgi:hypothetical protein
MHESSGGHSQKEAHEDEQLLSVAEEEVLMKWIKVQGQCGVPMTYTTVAQYAGEIAEMAIGGSWLKCFFHHYHPDLKVKMTVPLEKACAKALNRTAVNKFYGILEGIIKEYSILPKNIYNMDKKGIQLGIGARTAALVDCKQTLVYSIKDGN